MPIIPATTPRPSTTRMMMAPKFRTSKTAVTALSTLHLLPVAGLLERAGRAVDRRLVEVLAHQHHPDGKAVGHAAGHRHRGTMRDVKRRRVADHLHRPPAVLLAARPGPARGRRLHPHGGSDR